MKHVFMGISLATAVTFISGCGAELPAPTEAPYNLPQSPRVESSRNVEDRGSLASRAEISWETDADERFAKFLQDNSGGMVKKAAVGLEKRGELRVEISRIVEPEDTLKLTKSLMAGARKDFPDRSIILSLYDPQDSPILKASFVPGKGVHYQITPGKPDGGTTAVASAPKADSNLMARGGITERDQAFAEWAETQGKSMLRYVQADLERHGRLWFGVTRDVKPEDVRPLTKSLLNGARKEFPQDNLVATVFDPEGERIGRAHLERDGEVRWEE